MRDYKKFYTPEPIANFMAYLLQPKPHDYVLEPHAGSGRLIKAVIDLEPRVHICAVESNKDEVKTLFPLTAGGTLLSGDFLTFNPEVKFDGCIANPPFGNGIDLDAHIRKIRNIVKGGGRIVMILPLDQTVGMVEGVSMQIPNWARNSDGSETMIKIVNFLNPIG